MIYVGRTGGLIAAFSLLLFGLCVVQTFQEAKLMLLGFLVGGMLGAIWEHSMKDDE